MEYKDEVEQEQEQEKSYVPEASVVIETNIKDLGITLEIIEALS